MAPMTRCRALDTLATPAMGVYYRQRASAGGLLVSEGVCVSPNAHGYGLVRHTPTFFIAKFGLHSMLRKTTPESKDAVRMVKVCH